MTTGASCCDTGGSFDWIIGPVTVLSAAGAGAGLEPIWLVVTDFCAAWTCGPVNAFGATGASAGFATTGLNAAGGGGNGASLIGAAMGTAFSVAWT